MKRRRQPRLALIPYDFPEAVLVARDLVYWRHLLQRALPDGWTAGFEGAWGPRDYTPVVQTVVRAFVDAQLRALPSEVA